MKSATGICKYCHQLVALQITDGEDPTEEELNAYASQECNCKEGEIQRRRDFAIERVRKQIENYTANVKEAAAGEALIHLIPMIVEQQITKVTMKVGDAITYKISLDKDLNPIVERTETITDMVAG